MTLWVCSTGSWLSMFFGGVQILRTLAAQPDDAAALRDHGLTQVVVQILLGIGVLGVELAIRVCAILISGMVLGPRAQASCV